MQEKTWYSEKWVGRQATFSPSRYVKSLKLYNCRHFSKATKPKGKLSTTAKKNWLLQANEKKDRAANRRRTFGPNRKTPPKLNLDKIGKLVDKGQIISKQFLVSSISSKK